MSQQHPARQDNKDLLTSTQTIMQKPYLLQQLRVLLTQRLQAQQRNGAGPLGTADPVRACEKQRASVVSDIFLHHNAKMLLLQRPDRSCTPSRGMPRPTDSQSLPFRTLRCAPDMPGCSARPIDEAMMVVLARQAWRGKGGKEISFVPNSLNSAPGNFLPTQHSHCYTSPAAGPLISNFGSRSRRGFGTARFMCMQDGSKWAQTRHAYGS